MLGYVVKEDRLIDFFSSKVVGLMRQAYACVEKQVFL
jgi:hypothetical protein